MPVRKTPMQYILVTKGPPSGPPESLPQPDPQQLEAFFAAIGRAIASWQMVEGFLFLVFARVIGAPSLRPLSAAFHTAMNFRGRLDMTNAAILEQIKDKVLLGKWAKLYDKAVDKAKRRNELAHAVLTFDPSQKQKTKHLYLRSSFVDFKRSKLNELREQDMITEKVLSEMENSFAALHEHLVKFWDKLPDRQAVAPPQTPSQPSSENSQ